MEHSVASDSGAQIRDGIKSVGKIGACSEDSTSGAPAGSIWPYDVEKFQSVPPPTCFSQAKLDRAVSYMRVPQSLAQLKGCLAAGFPFVLGFTVYESFESPDV